MALENFEIVKVIGRGSFAKVYLVRLHDQKSQTFSFYAMKVLKKTMIVQKNQFKYTMDKFKEKDARFYAAELLLAINCLHSNGFIYRDMKTENILIDSEGHCRLTDFGLAKEFKINENELHYTFCGTPQYLAPELLKKQGYTYLVDYWGLGILIHELVAGRPPHNSPFPYIIKEIVETAFKPNKKFSLELNDLLAGLLERDPGQRLGSESKGGFKGIQDHPFFKELNWDLVLAKGYDPPIKPKTKDLGSTQNIEGVFLSETIKNTPELLTSEQLGNMKFPGFTYNEEVVAQKDSEYDALDFERESSFKERNRSHTPVKEIKKIDF